MTGVVEVATVDVVVAPGLAAYPEGGGGGCGGGGRATKWPPSGPLCWYSEAQVAAAATPPLSSSRLKDRGRMKRGASKHPRFSEGS